MFDMLQLCITRTAMIQVKKVKWLSNKKELEKGVDADHNHIYSSMLP